MRRKHKKNAQAPNNRVRTWEIERVLREDPAIYVSSIADTGRLWLLNQDHKLPTMTLVFELKSGLLFKCYICQRETFNEKKAMQHALEEIDRLSKTSQEEARVLLDETQKKIKEQMERWDQMEAQQQTSGKTLPRP